MSSTLILRAGCIATQDDAHSELRGASLFLENGTISRILKKDDADDEMTLQTILDKASSNANYDNERVEVIDARHHVVIPGMVNTHHHMVQSLTRAIPSLQSAELFSWLKGLYPIWASLTPEMVRTSTKIAMAELLLSGCTTSSDHLYIYPNGIRLEDSIEAAHAIGMRFLATRGSMSVGESAGGLPPDRVVEKEPFILKESQRLIETYHDATHGAMTQVALAPCSPFSVSTDLMRESAKLARSYGVRLHTHLA
jgi:8-oxoguanine deaminase